MFARFVEADTVSNLDAPSQVMIKHSILNRRQMSTSDLIGTIIVSVIGYGLFMFIYIINVINWVDEKGNFGRRVLTEEDAQIRALLLLGIPIYPIVLVVIGLWWLITHASDLFLRFRILVIEAFPRKRY